MSKMKKTDFQVKQDKLNVDFVRPTSIEGKAAELKVAGQNNFKKSAATSLTIKIPPQCITGDPLKDGAMLDTLKELALEAIKFHETKRLEWLEKHSDADPDQLQMGFDGDDGE